MNEPRNRKRVLHGINENHVSQMAKEFPDWIPLPLCMVINLNRNKAGVHESSHVQKSCAIAKR